MPRVPSSRPSRRQPSVAMWLLAAVLLAASAGHGLDWSLSGGQGGGEPLMAVADLHGDLKQAFKALLLAGAVDERGGWAGGRATLVQTGDMLDRGPDSLAVISLLERLKGEAAAAGGRVVTLLGNHELMNLGGDFRYVAPGELAWLARNASDPATAGSSWDPHSKGDVSRGKALWAAALRPGRPAGNALRGMRVAALAGSGDCRTLFVHAGLKPSMLREAATLARQDLASLSPDQRVEVLNAQLSKAVQDCFRQGGEQCPDDSTAPAALKLLKASDGPLWLRSYMRTSGFFMRRVCAEVAEALELVGARHMVAGHNVQPGGRPRALCEGALHLIDAGVSRAYGGAAAAWRCADGRAEAKHSGRDGA